MHPFELLIYFSSVGVCIVVPMHPIHILLVFHILAYGPAIAHCGYAGFQGREKVIMPLGDFFHQTHHRYFECNYGTPEIPLDLWFGTYHDGSDESTLRIRNKRKLRRSS